MSKSTFGEFIKKSMINQKSESDKNFRRRNPKLIMAIGLPASGKSKNRPDDCIILCKDDIRFSFYNRPKTELRFIPNFEPIIQRIEKTIFKILVDEKVNIYIDSTNYDYFHRRYYISHAFRRGYKIIYYLFSNLVKAEERNYIRLRKVVPKKSFDYIKNKFEFPRPEEINDFKIEVIEFPD